MTAKVHLPQPARRASLGKPGAFLQAALLFWCVLAGGGSAYGQEGSAPAVPQATAPQAPNEPWGIACRALAPGKTACSLFHRQVTQQGAQIMALEVIGISSDLPAMLLTAPLGTGLTDAPLLAIDGQALVVQPSWRACTQEGCVARLDDAELPGRLAAGNTLQVTLPITTETANNITLDVPLSGFAAALKTIQDGEQE